MGPQPVQLKLPDPPKASSNSHFSPFPGVGVIFFPSLFYSQTLLFLAENRKLYQIGITVLFAVVFFPKDWMNLGFVRKPSAVYAQTYLEPEKENEGGENPGFSSSCKEL